MQMRPNGTAKTAPSKANARPLATTAICLALTIGCSSGETFINPFSSSIEELVIEIGYQEKAKPLTMTNPLGKKSFALVENNLAALFGDNGPSIVIRGSADQADVLPPGSDRDFSADEVRELAAAYRDVNSEGGRLGYYVMYLDGYYYTDGARASGTLGIALVQERIIVIFSPEIVTTAAPTFTEQTTTLHELGHGMGLVNNGVDMVTAHQSVEHGHHCDNPLCIMYWSNENADDMQKFILNLQQKSDVVLFGNQCLADAEAARGSQ